MATFDLPMKDADFPWLRQFVKGYINHPQRLSTDYPNTNHVLTMYKPYINHTNQYEPYRSHIISIDYIGKLTSSLFIAIALHINHRSTICLPGGRIARLNALAKSVGAIASPFEVRRQKSSSLKQVINKKTYTVHI